MSVVSRFAQRTVARLVPALGTVARCNGCGRAKAEVAHMVAGPDVYLCDACFQKAAQVLPPRHAAPDAVRCRFCKQPRARTDVTSVGTLTICADCLGLVDEILTEAAQANHGRATHT